MGSVYDFLRVCSCNGLQLACWRGKKCTLTPFLRMLKYQDNRALYLPLFIVLVFSDLTQPCGPRHSKWSVLP